MWTHILVILGSALTGGVVTPFIAERLSEPIVGVKIPTRLEDLARYLTTTIEPAPRSFGEITPVTDPRFKRTRTVCREDEDLQQSICTEEPVPGTSSPLTPIPNKTIDIGSIKGVDPVRARDLALASFGLGAATALTTYVIIRSVTR